MTPTTAAFDSIFDLSCECGKSIDSRIVLTGWCNAQRNTYSCINRRQISVGNWGDLRVRWTAHHGFPHPSWRFSRMRTVTFSPLEVLEPRRLLSTTTTTTNTP